MPQLPVISGVGRAGLTRAEAAPCSDLAVQALDAAIADAGLVHGQIDGLLISRSSLSTEPTLDLHAQAGLGELTLLQFVDCEGTSAIQQLHNAMFAVASGQARHVACVFADTPLRSGLGARQAFTRVKEVAGLDSLRYSAGAAGAPARYAMSARHYLHKHGVEETALGAVAVSSRAWASLNPDAALQDPLTMQQYLQSRFIVEPLRLLDCAYPVNGAIAFIVSNARHPGASPGHPPVHIHALAQSHAASANAFAAWNAPAAVSVARRIYETAGIDPQMIDVREFYDAFSVMTLMALESYGFCAPGEAGDAALDGTLAPGGRLPTNTGGGHLSGHYMQGMTPLLEAIEQARGSAGARQCEPHGLVLATNEGGWFEHHAAVLLSPREPDGANRAWA